MEWDPFSDVRTMMIPVRCTNTGCNRLLGNKQAVIEEKLNAGWSWNQIFDYLKIPENQWCCRQSIMGHTWHYYQTQPDGYNPETGENTSGDKFTALNLPGGKKVSERRFVSGHLIGYRLDNGTYVRVDNSPQYDKSHPRDASVTTIAKQSRISEQYVAPVTEYTGPVYADEFLNDEF